DAEPAPSDPAFHDRQPARLDRRSPRLSGSPGAAHQGGARRLRLSPYRTRRSAGSGADSRCLRGLAAPEAAFRGLSDPPPGEGRRAVKASDAMQVLAGRRGDAIVVCALGMAANEWWGVTRSEDSFYMHGAMGFGASFALGLALSLPQTPVWVLNSDGSLCMNLGCLLTEAQQAPKNLRHFVLDNGVYQTVGAVPMVNQRRSDYAAIALGAG